MNFVHVMALEINSTKSLTPCVVSSRLCKFAQTKKNQTNLQAGLNGLSLASTLGPRILPRVCACTPSTIHTRQHTGSLFS